MLHIYVDGSFRPSTHGAYGIVVLNNKKTDIVALHSGYIPDATNNIAELMAIKKCLELTDDKFLRIYTDSKYCIDSLSFYRHIWEKTNWITSTGTPVKNKDLIQQIIPLYDARTIQMIKVKGHAGDPYNTMCDYMAKTITAKAVKQEREHGRVIDPHISPM